MCVYVGHALQGETERMTELLEDMKAQKIYPGMHVYMSIIDSLSRGGHVKQIPEVSLHSRLILTCLIKGHSLSK